MKNIFLSAVFILITITSYGQKKLSTTSGHINFFSTTPVEDIEANNYKVMSNLTPSTGILVFSVPMQSFEFPKAKMQQHYNSKKFLHTKKFPKGKFKGTITNVSDIKFSSNGTYQGAVVGKLTIHGVTNDVSEKITLTVKDGDVMGMTEFSIILSDVEKANAMYLDSEEGESKVLIVTGNIATISTDQLGQQVVLLKNNDEKMGVSCTFTLETNSQVSTLKIGNHVSIKGVIRSGAEYDIDLDLSENVIIEKSALIKKYD